MDQHHMKQHVIRSRARQFCRAKILHFASSSLLIQTKAPILIIKTRFLQNVLIIYECRE